MSVLTEIRTAAWHLRRGGVRQVAEWRSRRRAEAGIVDRTTATGAQGYWSGRGKRATLTFRATDLDALVPRRPEIRVGVVLDDFSALAFGAEWTTVPLTRSGWPAQIEDLDFVFLESAWRGNGGEWQFQFTGDAGPKQDLMELLAHCRDRGVPTALWNKEDPPHYDDFLPVARLVDHVFTTDHDRLEAYARDLGHERISVLTFAAQHAVHRPVRPRTGWHERDVAFAGMYFVHKYPERRQQVEVLLGAAADLADRGRGTFEIFSRFGDRDNQYRFPENLSRFVVGELPYVRMLTAYKAYKVFLNVNSVVDSPSMCARRVFECTASGASVVSGPSKAVSALFPDDEIPVVTEPAQAADVLEGILAQPELAARSGHRARRRIWRAHTYSHRAEQVLAEIRPDLAREPALPGVSVLLCTMRPDYLEAILAQLASQTVHPAEVVLLTHGFSPDREVKRRLEELCSFRIVWAAAPASSTLGECLNLCVDLATAEVLAKVDDDDRYAPHYLEDQLHALGYSGADIVGKAAHFVHVASRNVTGVRFAAREERFGRFVMGPTIMARRHVFDAVRFPSRSRGEDTVFLASAVSAGFSIYSASKYNYCQVRRPSGHTWDVPDSEMLASLKVESFGDPIAHISV